MKNLIKKLIREQVSKEDIKKVYMNSVYKSLFDLYGKDPETWGDVGVRGKNKKGGIINIYSINELIAKKEKKFFTIDGGDWSILNYFDTNPKVTQYIIKLYTQDTGKNIETIEELNDFGSWILETGKRLFTPGPILNQLIDLNFKSLSKGIRNEKKAYDLIKNYFSKNTELQIGEPNKPGSTSDRHGVDFTFKNLETGRVYKFQAKPFSGFRKTPDDKYIISSYNVQNIKQNPVDYFIFTTDEVVGTYVFKNKVDEYEINGDDVIFNYPPIGTLE